MPKPRSADAQPSHQEATAKGPPRGETNLTRLEDDAKPPSSFQKLRSDLSIEANIWIKTRASASDDIGVGQTIGRGLGLGADFFHPSSDLVSMRGAVPVHLVWIFDGG